MPACRACDHDVPESSRFCPHCGTSLNGDVAVTRTEAISSSAPTPVSRPVSSTSSSLDEGRFLPGTLLVGRYRIVALIGRGGMGEVYRANDLKLSQPVALKFLPEATAKNETVLGRFYNEIRIARQVSHPNVCRVYDLGDVDGQPYLSMEYVDGEDLGSLLRRIGRLPEDKALEIARKLCAGLAAAHEQGILHRDLKPSNVMLDARGQILLTDFGLAGLADQIGGAEVRNGTPAYMAPEQLEGKEVTIRSDIYSLGLVLYEIFTGKRPYESDTLAGLERARKSGAPPTPSTLVKDLDPRIERVILRCLESDPARRPPTALAVAGALPGGDPLAAALAAGETPSPEMVAAAGETTGLRPGVAVTCLVGILVALSVGIYLSIRYSGLEKMHLDQPPEVLAEKAREITRTLGYTEKAVDSGFGFRQDDDFSNYVEQHDSKSRPSWDEVLAGRPTMLEFWFRQSPKNMSPNGYTNFTPGILHENDPPTTDSGMVDVKLDPKGRLIAFHAIPPQKYEEATSNAQPNWAPLFSAAELDPAKLKEAPPQWNSLAAADSRAAWTGTWPGTSWPLRVEAAAWHGKPVFFRLIGDWTRPDRMVSEDTAAERKNRWSQMLILAFFLAVLVTGALMARRNYRQGRADREGALRLAVVIFVLEVLLWLCLSHLVAGLDAFGSLMLCCASALEAAGITWMIY